MLSILRYFYASAQNGWPRALCFRVARPAVRPVFEGVRPHDAMSLYSAVEGFQLNMAHVFVMSGHC